MKTLFALAALVLLPMSASAQVSDAQAAGALAAAQSSTGAPASGAAHLVHCADGAADCNARHEVKERLRKADEAAAIESAKARILQRKVDKAAVPVPMHDAKGGLVIPAQIQKHEDPE
jgi:hypothetical protein